MDDKECSRPTINRGQDPSQSFCMCMCGWIRRLCERKQLCCFESFSSLSVGTTTVTRQGTKISKRRAVHRVPFPVKQNKFNPVPPRSLALWLWRLGELIHHTLYPKIGHGKWWFWVIEYSSSRILDLASVKRRGSAVCNMQSCKHIVSPTHHLRRRSNLLFKKTKTKKITPYLVLKIFSFLSPFLSCGIHSSFSPSSSHRCSHAKQERSSSYNLPGLPISFLPPSRPRRVNKERERKNTHRRLKKKTSQDTGNQSCVPKLFF